jgi:subtilisin family serine protease
VINISLASYLAIADASSTPARNAMAAVMQEASDLGVVITVAAGNYASSIMDWVPASLPMVATVTAIDESGQAAASFSNFLDKADPNSSNKTTLLAAPGAAIRSSVPLAISSSGYRALSGTSQASPHVAGALHHHHLETK